MDNILFFGSEGRIARTIIATLKNDFHIIGVDILENTSSICDDYICLKHDHSNLKEIYETELFYAVIHCQQFKPKGFVNHSLDKFDLNFTEEVFRTNLIMTMESSALYIKQVKAHNYLGRIINLSSTYGLISSSPTLYKNTDFGNPYAYTVSKFGVIGLTKYIASYYKEYNVLCNSISPHGIENNQEESFKENYFSRSPLGRLSDPKELIPAFNFLLDKENTYTNGANIPIDGGWTAC